MAQLFDPLNELASEAAEVMIGARKREIGNILKSYVGFYDPFAELIQNAMDAVDDRERTVKESSYQKRLWIEIDLRQNAFSITDNGVGFSESQFKKFLAPNISFKQTGSTRGKKGVGATYLAYGFNNLRLGTKTPDYSVVAEFKNGRQWVDDTNNVVSRPIVVDSKDSHSAFAKLDRGSTFTLQFSGNVRPKDLSWVGATTAEQWRTILLVKTPLGHVTIGPASPTPIHFNLRVIAADGTATELRDQLATYIFPHTVISSSVLLDNIVAEQKSRIDRQLDASKLPDKFSRLNGIFVEYETPKLQELLKDHPHAKLISQHNVTAYAYFCYSVKVWDQFNDDVVGLRKGQRILRGGLQIAANYMPQGDLIAIPLTSNIGYQNQVHSVVHFLNAEPDLGRKGFQPEVRDLAEEIAVRMVTVLKKWRPQLKKDTGAPPQIAEEAELHDWIRSQEEHEKSSPLTISNENFFLPVKKVAISSLPQSEQDVIVLFNQLIAGGVIRGIRLLATSQNRQYDGVYRFIANDPLVNHVFDKGKNPLGVHEMSHVKPVTSKPYVLEYKYNLDALIQEFETEEKSERDIDLAVVWQLGSEWSKRYSITSLLDLDNLQHRPFHGVTHLVKDGATGERRFYAIVLSELVQYLNNVDGVQEYHRKTFAE